MEKMEQLVTNHRPGLELVNILEVAQAQLLGIECDPTMIGENELCNTFMTNLSLGNQVNRFVVEEEELDNHWKVGVDLVVMMRKTMIRMKIPQHHRVLHIHGHLVVESIDEVPVPVL